jgi:hypothetical protein
MDIPTFHTREELFKWLKTNKATLISQKKFQPKFADAVSYSVPVHDHKGSAVKDFTTESLAQLGRINIKAVINTTGLLDSHGDVHIKGLWKKSLQENKNISLLQEHQMKFDKIITTSVKAAAVDFSWKDLGFKFEGATQALFFDCDVEPTRNPFMYDQYVKGYVNNHSVGMQYVTLYLCINSEEKYYREEKEYWDKYIKQVVNSDVAEEQGYFWAVTEAKVIEGSAVVLGSNYATPTISVTESKAAGESTATNTEPPEGTQQKGIDYNYVKQNLKITI